MYSNVDDIPTTENTVNVSIEQFKKLGYDIQFSGFNENDLGVLRFGKKMKK